MRTFDPAAGTPEPQHDCSACSRLVSFRAENQSQHDDWYNGAVPSFGDPQARLLIVGLAPGLRGANRTGRPFTGDFAGDLLYDTLIQFGFANGTYRASAEDGLTLVDCMITNAVRCVPPQNKPTTEEIRTCRPFLAARIAALANLVAIIALGRIAHDSVLAALGARRSKYTFAHGAAHAASDGLMVYDSYHCSRYNTNTRRLTPEMFHSVFAVVKHELATMLPRH